jgi:hypothetical protein
MRTMVMTCKICGSTDVAGRIGGDYYCLRCLNAIGAIAHEKVRQLTKERDEAREVNAALADRVGQLTKELEFRKTIEPHVCDVVGWGMKLKIECANLAHEVQELGDVYKEREHTVVDVFKAIVALDYYSPQEAARCAKRGADELWDMLEAKASDKDNN